MSEPKKCPHCDGAGVVRPKRGEEERRRLAGLYARRHREADPGIVAIFHLPTGAPDDEIRLAEVNKLVSEHGHPEAVDFGVHDRPGAHHRLLVLDVTPLQWERVRRGEVALPQGWTLRGGYEIGGGS